jgi:2-polyprenyl-3-methyl-5-hydroxy-6-metoxy-1,4-benzoquinol methylase
MKQFVKSLSRFGVEINFAMDSGVSFGGLNISQARKPLADRSSAALHHCQTLGAKTILDVGSGGGHHASAFAAKGGQVTCIDFGTSVYAQEKGHAPGIELVEVDFLHWQSPKTFDLVWASHVLEHQRNPGQFIDKLISLCAPKGHVAIIVPTPPSQALGRTSDTLDARFASL